MNYERINWENAPSTDTPLDADNLNKMDEALDTLNREVAKTRSDVEEVEETAASLGSQIAGIIRLEDGSTTGDAELINGRVGRDGTTYSTIGDAIRGQIGDLRDHVIEVSDEEPEEFYNKIWVNDDDQEIEIPTKAELDAVDAAVDELNERMDNLKPGLSDEAKVALLACFENVAWIDEHGQDYYDALAEALDVEPVPPVDPSRVFLYKFNDSLLSSGNADLGLTAPSPVYVSGKYDKCIQIGSSVDNVPRNFNILSDNMPRFDKDFTLATWFKANVSTGATHTCFRFAKNISDSTLPVRTSELENLTYHNNYENWASGTTINQRYVGIALSYLWSASISRFYPSLSFFNKAHDAAYVFGLGNGTSDVPKQTWTHFAFCRKDNNCAIYIDGVKACSFTYSGELYVPSQIVFGCALTQTDPNGISLQSGAVPDIDEFYINDRECIYDGNFTPGEIVI